MAEINIHIPQLKLDINNLCRDAAGIIAKAREDRRYNRQAYDELLEKYALLVKEVGDIRMRLNGLLKEMETRSLPSSDEIKQLGDMMTLMGCKNPDGSLNIEKLAQFTSAFEQQKS